MNKKYMITQLIVTVTATLTVHCAQNTLRLSRIRTGRLQPETPAERQERELDDSLLRAISRGDIAQVKHLLSQGVCVDYKPRWGYSDIPPTTPLLTAVKVGQTTIVQLLLSAGALVNPSSFADAPLLAAARNGNLKLVELLLANHADVNLIVGLRTALSDAMRDAQRNANTKKNCTEIVKQLLAHGADPNAPGQGFRSPLLGRAASRGLTAVVQLLYQYGTTPLTEGQQERLTQIQPDALTLLKKQIPFAVQRAQAVRGWMLRLEQREGLPRDITRLVWEIAGEWSAYMPPVEGK